MKIIILFICSCLIGACSSSGLPWSNENQKKYARLLQEKGLYEQSVEAFQELADNGGLTDKERASVYYIMADMCFDKTHDYEKALGCYMKSEISGAEGQMLVNVQQRIIACLERLGKSFDAQKELDRRTLHDTDQPLPGETIVAVIGKRDITMRELNEAIRLLPEYLQKQYSSDPKKLEFLQQYLATELLYDSARRKGLDRNPNTLKAVEQMKKNLMVEALLADELSSKIAVTETEVSLYFQANKDQFKGKELKEVKHDIITVLSAEKKQTAYKELMERLMQAEKVVIYEEYFAKPE
ncbi:MAG: hypothetical protein ABII23_08250 [bacterium]